MQRDEYNKPLVWCVVCGLVAACALVYSVVVTFHNMRLLGMVGAYQQTCVDPNTAEELIDSLEHVADHSDMLTDNYQTCVTLAWKQAAAPMRLLVEHKDDESRQVTPVGGVGGSQK